MNKIYKFQDYVYEGAYSPYYDNYKGHTFIITDVMVEDPTGGHVRIECVDDPTVKVIGYVHLYDLELVNGD